MFEMKYSQQQEASIGLLLFVVVKTNFVKLEAELVEKQQEQSALSAATPTECAEDAQCTGNALLLDLGSLSGKDGLRRLQGSDDRFWSSGEQGVAQGEQEGWDWGNISAIQLSFAKNASTTMTGTNCNDRTGWSHRCLTNTKICSCAPKAQAKLLASSTTPAR